MSQTCRPSPPPLGGGGSPAVPYRRRRRTRPSQFYHRDGLGTVQLGGASRESTVPGEHSEHPWSLGWLLLELCPSCPYLSSSLCALPFPASLGFYKVSVPLCYPRQRHWGKWWGSPLFFRDLFGAVRAESWCGVSGEGWGGAGSEPGRSLKRGMKGYPQLPDLTHLSPSAGSPMGLLGPCCVRWHCVQKSAPQVRQSEGGGRGIPGTIWSGCFYGSGSTGHREEDRHR